MKHSLCNVITKNTYAKLVLFSTGKATFHTIVLPFFRVNTVSIVQIILSTFVLLTNDSVNMLLSSINT